MAEWNESPRSDDSAAIRTIEYSPDLVTDLSHFLQSYGALESTKVSDHPIDIAAGDVRTYKLDLDTLDLDFHSTDDCSTNPGDSDVVRQCTWKQAAANTFFYLYGAGAVPYAIAQMGLWPSMIVLALFTVVSFVSGHLLLDICVRRRVYSYPAVGELAFGRCGSILVSAMQVASFVLGGIAQTQGAGSNWQMAFPSAPICQSSWLWINTAVSIAFYQIPSFSGSAMMLAATMLMVVITVASTALTLVYLPLYGPYCPEHLCYDGQTTTTMLAAAANLCFTFGSHAILPEEVREMVVPKQMHRAFSTAYAVAVPLYVLIGYGAFYTYGIFVSGSSLNLNFPDNLGNQLVITLGLFGGVSYGQILLFLKLELRLGVLPSDWWQISNPKTNRVPYVPPVLFRFLFRSSVALVYLFLGEMLLSYGLQNTSSIAGAVACSAMTFYLPFVFHWRVFRSEIGVRRGGLYSLGILLGIAILWGGLYFTFLNMGDSPSASLFSAPCRENAFFIGASVLNGGGGAFQCGAEQGDYFLSNFTSKSCPSFGGHITCSQFGNCVTSGP